MICGQWDKAAIQQFLGEQGEIPGLHFCFVEEWWVEEWLKTGRPLFYTHYLPLNLWHRRAFKLAEELHQKHQFALVHHVSIVGYREPGYLWKLHIPFVWGPVGGTQNYPWRFLKMAGWRGALKEGLRAIINRLQFQLSPRVRQAARKARVILAANSEIQRDFERIHGIKPVVLLDTGLEMIKNDRKEFHPERPLRILWSGQLEHHKALHLLLHALAQLPRRIHYELTILGKGPLRQDWQKLANRLGIGSHCAWLGELPFQEAMKRYDLADVCVFTSLRDTSGNVVLEALSQGVPVICFDHQGVADMVNNECGVKIPLTTPSDGIANLRNAIIGFAVNRDKLKILSRGAQDRARLFLWENNAKQMAEIYQDVLKAHAPT